jgi:streptogramin lyase
VSDEHHASDVERPRHLELPVTVTDAESIAIAVTESISVTESVAVAVTESVSDAESHPIAIAKSITDANSDCNPGSDKPNVVRFVVYVLGLGERPNDHRESSKLQWTVYDLNRSRGSDELVQRDRDGFPCDGDSLHGDSGRIGALHVQHRRRQRAEYDLDDRRHDHADRRIVMSRSLRNAVLLLSALAGGCSGGATSSPHAVATAAPQTVMVQVTIYIPAASPSAVHRAPQYVSASTKSVAITVTPSGGSAGIVTIANCSPVPPPSIARAPQAAAQGTVCTTQVPAPVGSDTFTMGLYDALNGVGNVLSTGTVTQTIVIDQLNTVSVVFNGVVASLAVILNPTSVTVGTSNTVAVTVNALDADGNTIVGSGVYVNAAGNPLTVNLADSDVSGATHLSQSSLTLPTSGITLSYNGASIANPTITASATGLSSANAQLAVKSSTPTLVEFAVLSGAPFFIVSGPDGNLWFTEPLAHKIGKITTSGTITEFTPPGSIEPFNIISGPDGNLWFTDIGSGNIGRATTSGTITLFPTSSSSTEGITIGPDGNLWFVEPNAAKVGRITTSGTLSEFATTTSGSNPSWIVTGPDGNLWFTEYLGGGKIGKITPSGTITEFPTPTNFSGPSQITTGPDNNLWFTEIGVGQIGKITTSGTISEFLTSSSNSQPNDNIIPGPDGNLWFAENNASKIGRITTSGTLTEFATPTINSVPEYIIAAPDGNLWFTEESSGKIGRITTSGTITEFATSAGGSGPTDITVGPDGNVWFAESNGSKIGKVVLP